MAILDPLPRELRPQDIPVRLAQLQAALMEVRKKSTTHFSPEAARLEQQIRDLGAVSPSAAGQATSGLGRFGRGAADLLLSGPNALGTGAAMAMDAAFTPKTEAQRKTEAAADLAVANINRPVPLAAAKPTEEKEYVPSLSMLQKLGYGERPQGQQAARPAAAAPYAPIAAPGVNPYLAQLDTERAEMAKQGAPQFERVDTLKAFQDANSKLKVPERQGLSNMSDKRLGELALEAGLNMMAGTEPNAGANIGKAGAAALKSARVMNKEDYDDAMQQHTLNLQRIGHEAALGGADVNARNTNAAAGSKFAMDRLTGLSGITGAQAKIHESGEENKGKTGYYNMVGKHYTASDANDADRNRILAQAAAQKGPGTATDAKYAELAKIYGYMNSKDPEVKKFGESAYRRFMKGTKDIAAPMSAGDFNKFTEQNPDALTRGILNDERMGVLTPEQVQKSMDIRTAALKAAGR